MTKMPHIATIHKTIKFIHEIVEPADLILHLTLYTHQHPNNSNFNYEDEGSTLLQNIGMQPENYMVQGLRRPHLRVVVLASASEIKFKLLIHPLRKVLLFKQKFVRF